MRRIISVYLDSKIFQIDEDGYDVLSGILSGQCGRSELERQLSARFRNKLTDSKNVITYIDVVEVCYSLGFSISDAHAVKKLYRQPKDKVIAGVCTGLGEYFDVDPVIIRIMFIVSFFIISVGFWIYIALWIAVPKSGSSKQS